MLTDQRESPGPARRAAVRAPSRAPSREGGAEAEANWEVPAALTRRYVLLELIGEGAFGRVYAVRPREPGEAEEVRGGLPEGPGRGEGGGARGPDGPGAGPGTGDPAGAERGGRATSAPGRREGGTQDAVRAGEARAGPRPPSKEPMRRGPISPPDADLFRDAKVARRDQQVRERKQRLARQPPAPPQGRAREQAGAAGWGTAAAPAGGGWGAAALGGGRAGRAGAPSPAGAAAAGQAAAGGAAGVRTPSSPGVGGQDQRGPLAAKVVRPPRASEGLCVTALREASLLRALRHPNVVRLDEAFFDPRTRSTAMVFERLEADLHGLLADHRERGTHMHVHTFKSLAHQLLRGVCFLHSNWVLHRDLKPSNVLVSTSPPTQGTLRVADFGLARTCREPARPLAENGCVVTVWYRAPELLLGARHYGPPVDAWAIGCILAEMLTLAPLFHGPERSALDPTAFQGAQLQRLFRALGHPASVGWADVERLPHYRDNLDGIRARRPEHGSAPLRQVLWQASPTLRSAPSSDLLLDLLEKLLALDPARRLTVAAALRHPFFAAEPLPGANAFVAGGRLIARLPRQRRVAEGGTGVSGIAR